MFLSPHESGTKLKEEMSSDFTVCDVHAVRNAFYSAWHPLLLDRCV